MSSDAGVELFILECQLLPDIALVMHTWHTGALQNYNGYRRHFCLVCMQPHPPLKTPNKVEQNPQQSSGNSESTSLLRFVDMAQKPIP